MKRTVKAWAVGFRQLDGSYRILGATSPQRKADAASEAGEWRMAGNDGAKAIPCTITYDDGKPKRKAKRGRG